MNKLSELKPLPEKEPSEEKKEVRRADRFNVLCPKCRREAVLKS